MSDRMSLLDGAPAGRSQPMGPLVALMVVGVMIAITLGLKLLLHPDETMLASARDARHLLVAGEISALGSAELIAFIVIGATMILSPLLLIGALLLVELLVGPGTRERKDYRLIWITQIVFVTAATLIIQLGSKIALPGEPLFRGGAGSGPIHVLIVVIPVYLAAVFISDVFSYWLHRAQHRIPLLWKFHRVHHSPRDLDVAHYVTHPVEQLLQFLAIAIPTSLVIRVSPSGFFAIALLFTVHRHYIHMNIPVHFGWFGNVILDNRYHFIHHSRARADHNSNFAGIFPVLDMLFGTYRKPRPGPLPETGIEGDGAPARFSHFLLANWPADLEEQAEADSTSRKQKLAAAV